MEPLSPTEWLVMRCIWDLGPSEPNAVSHRLEATYGREYGPKTASVLLGRLVSKGYLSFRLGIVPRSGRRPHVYFPLVPLEAALQGLVEKFLGDYRLDPEEFDRAWEEFIDETRAAAQAPVRANAPAKRLPPRRS